MYNTYIYIIHTYIILCARNMFSSIDSKGKLVLFYKILFDSILRPRISNIEKQKQSSRVALRKRCPENMELRRRRTPMLRWDFSNVAL